MSTSLKRENASHFTEDEIFQRLTAAIFDHRLSPGTKLGEERLAEIFKVSRSRIRQVLSRLAYSKIVQIEHHKGAFVAEPTQSDARDVFEARKVIEPRDFAKILADRLPSG